MTRRGLALVLAVGAALGGACGGDDEADDAPREDAGTTTTASTEPLEFDGDPDSQFCQRSRDAAARPVLDPFEAGLDPREVELRFRALAQRFAGFAELAPDSLEDDLALLDERFTQLAAALDDADYDFEKLVEADADLSVFDDPALGAVADRLAAYQDQVCEP